MRLSFLKGILFLMLFAGALWARDAREQQRIDYLLQTVADLPGDVFIRNGTAYAGPAAVKHLRRKLEAGGEKVMTAENFIEGCAARSSLTRIAYKIRLTDGKFMETDAWFRAALKKYDREHPKPPPGTIPRDGEERIPAGVQ